MRFSLIIIVLFTLSSQSFAQDATDNDSADLKWANDLSDTGGDMVWEHLSAKFNEQEKLEGRGIYTPYSTSKLYVFVSSSMSIPLLKSYAEEALRYDGILVFKGLPNGSFKELAELMTQLKDGEDNVANATIDDESFDRFSISSVPAIVLTEEPPYHPNQTPYIKFDKISGNVGIKYALEQFSNSGEIKEEAAKHLVGAKDE